MFDHADSDQRTVIGLLGPVTVNGRDIAGERARRLLAALALAGDRASSASRLIEAVWDSEPPKSPSAALHTHVSRLRSALGAAGVDGSVIDGSGGRYRLVGVVTDIDLAADLLTADDVDDAAALWRGVPGDDLGSSDVARELADRAARLHDQIDDRRAHRALALGDFVAAADIAAERVSADPLDESAHILLMKALAGQRRMSEALAVYARLRRTLAQELGADPGPEASEYNAQLLAQSRAGMTSPVRRLPPAGVGLRDAGNELLGRATDLASIVGLLESHRVVTVQGPGGVGKTRIATEVGRLLSESGRAVYFVPLASVRSGDDLLVAVAGALGVGESELTNSGLTKVGLGTATTGLADRLRDAVRESTTVLIFDNCEQVIDSCAVLVDSLLTAGPGLRILATSRSPLLIPSEQVYQLPVLSASGDDPAAVELFRQRARAVRPSVELAPDAVADLCVRLDGLPLAIELAAARVRTMGVEEIGTRIAERFELLRSTDRTAPDRHRTLHAVIEWSWDLLDDAPRTVLMRTCLFPGGFSRAAAEHVTGMSGVLLDDALAALADQSLLQVYDSRGQVRFRMLEMVREFGEQLLRQTGEHQRVIALAVEWARGTAHGIRTRYATASDLSLVIETERETDNLVWALRCALETAAAGDADAVGAVVEVFPVLGAFWASRGLHPEVQSWGVRMIDVLPTPPDDLDDDVRHAWQAAVVIAVLQVLPSGLLRPIARGRLLLRRLIHRDAIFDDPFELLGAMALSRRVYGFYRLCVRGTARGRPDDVRALALAIRLNVRENFGNLAGAAADSAELSSLRPKPDSFLAAMVDMTTASVLSQQGDWARALSLYEASLRRFRDLGSDDDMNQVGAYIVANRLQLGDFARAGEQLDSIRNSWRPGDPSPQGNPETVAVMILATAEYLRTCPPTADTIALRGDVDIADVYRQSGRTLLAGHPMVARDPGAVMTIAAVAAGLLAVGDVDTAEEFTRSVTVPSGVNGASDNAWIDIPQTGNLALVVGAVKCARVPGDRDGTALLVLSERLRVRHDYPSMHQLIVRRRELSGASDTEWSAIEREFGDLSRQRAFAETDRILGERPLD